MRRTMPTVLSVILLILLDQVIKLYIKFNMMGMEFDIIGNILSFKPYINVDYSWINSMGNFGVDLITHIILNVLLLMLMFLVYDFIIIKYSMDRLVNASFVFIYAGGFCSLIDKIAWGGSLDYIYLKGFFIFDLKDLYLTVFECSLITMTILNYKGILKISSKEITKNFRTYFRERFMHQNIDDRKLD